MLTFASFHNVKPFVNAASKLWAKEYSAKKSGFNALNNDIKSIIIKEFSPSDFMALVEANDNLDDSSKEEMFKIALKIHHDQEPKMGVRAQELYEELLSPRFVLIACGNYQIGSPNTEADRYDDERLHGITLSAFEIMESSVTQEQYAMKMGKNPSYFKEDDKPGRASFKIIEVNGNKIPVWSDHPVENVTWFEAKAYAEVLSKDDPRYNYLLPTEAQLEVAFRGGSNSRLCFR